MANGLLVHIAKDSVRLTGLHGRVFALLENVPVVNSSNALCFDVCFFNDLDIVISTITNVSTKLRLTTRILSGNIKTQ